MASYTSGSGEQKTFTQFHAPGQYLVAVINAEEKQSSNGNDMIVLKCEVIGPDVAEGEGARFTENLVFTANAAWRIDNYRKASGDNVVAGENVDMHGDDQIGKQFEAILGIEEGSNGKTYNTIAEYVMPSAPATAGATADKSDEIPF